MRDASKGAGARMLDPVCDMIVDIADARENGLTLEMPEREYAFCSAGCLKTFSKSPTRFKAKVDAWVAANSSS